MLVARRTVMREAVAAADTATVVVAFAASWWVRTAVFGSAMPPFENYLWLSWVIVPAWLGSLWFCGLYDSSSYASLTRLLGRLGRAQVIAGMLLLSTMYLTKSEAVSRILIQVFLVASFVLLCAEKLAVRATIERRRRSALHLPRVLLVATPADVARYLDLVARHASMTTQVVGILSPASSSNGAPPADSYPPILGSPADLDAVLRNHVVDEIVVTTAPDRAVLRRMADTCAARGIVMRMMVDVPPATVGAWRADDCGEGAFFLTLAAIPHDALQLALKRVLDVTGALAGLILAAVVWLIFGWRIRRETGASVLFAQQRASHNGRRFTLYKFRTMYADAERGLGELRAHNQMKGPMFKLRDDPRVTATGMLLRRRHLDELPQFWNVLKGEMSLVGTRPPTDDEVATYEEHHHRRLSMKPGLTGLWQLNGNHGVSDFEEVVRLDCEYIEHWSLWLDLRIIANTVTKVLRGDGW